MKRLLIYIILSVAFICAGATDFADETLHYKVMFKWGLINKQAGTVAITLANRPEQYVGQLTAKSEIGRASCRERV